MVQKILNTVKIHVAYHTEGNVNPNPDEMFTLKRFNFASKSALVGIRNKNRSKTFRKVLKVCVGHQATRNFIQIET